MEFLYERGYPEIILFPSAATVTDIAWQAYHIIFNITGGRGHNRKRLSRLPAAHQIKLKRLSSRLQTGNNRQTGEMMTHCANTTTVTAALNINGFERLSR